MSNLQIIREEVGHNFCRKLMCTVNSADSVEWLKFTSYIVVVMQWKEEEGGGQGRQSQERDWCREREREMVTAV